jgi:hypothetical protein
MFYGNDPEFGKGLAARLAQKAGLSRDDAQKALDALSEVLAEEEAGRNPSHAITIPLVQRENGSMMVDMSGYSAWWPFSKKPPATPPAPVPPVPNPIKVTKGPGPGPNPGPYPGAYPGPSVSIRTDDWLGEDLKLDETALERLRGMLVKADIPKSSKKMLGDSLIDHENEF